MQSEDTYHLVQARYGELAEYASSSETRGCEDKVATAFGYDPSELRSLPENANLGVSCGNPLATAKLREGETVVDLGSGGGIDVFLAAKKVGPQGKAIGVDMTKRMLNLARKNVEKAGVSNASFIEASITSIPLPNSSTDCIISNCVINLVPSAEKNIVFQEMFRLLKPGGRVAISDILARKQLPSDISKNLSLYVGCIAGASQVADYERYLREAGFQDILIDDTKGDLNVYKETWPNDRSDVLNTSCCGDKSSLNLKRPDDVFTLDFNEWAGAFRIYAIKPTTLRE